MKRVNGMRSLLLVLVFLREALSSSIHCVSNEQCKYVHSDLCSFRVNDSSTKCVCGLGSASITGFSGFCFPGARATRRSSTTAARYERESDSRLRIDSAIPLWPMDWDCSGDSCSHFHPSGRVVYTITGPELIQRMLESANETRVVHPSEVGIACYSEYRFSPSPPVSTSIDPVTGYRPILYPDHSRHCLSCQEWCGANGSCFGTFQCECVAGYTGERCDQTVETSTDRPLRTSQGVAPTTPILLSRLAFLSDIVTGYRVTSYALTEPPEDAFRMRYCSAHTDCLSPDTERCMIDVERSLVDGDLRYSCFCKQGYIPSAFLGRCIAPAVTGGDVWVQHSSSVFRDTVSRRGTPLAGKSVQFGPIGLLFLTQTTVEATGTTITTAGESDQSTIFVDCGNNNITGATFDRTKDASLWCPTKLSSECTGAGLVLSSNGFTCVCANQSLVMPECNETTTACRQRRCNGNGECQPFGCSCDEEWGGFYCNITADVCAAKWCNSRGKCSGTSLETGEPLCQCDAGFFGDYCSMVSEDCRDIFCNRRGECDPVTTACICEWEWQGPSCERPSCVDGATWDGQRCVCPPGSYGDNCANKTCGVGGYIGNGATCVCGSAYGYDPDTQLPCGRHNCYPGYPIDLDRCACPGSWMATYDGERYCSKVESSVVGLNQEGLVAKASMTDQEVRSVVYSTAFLLSVFVVQPVSWFILLRQSKT